MGQGQVEQWSCAPFSIQWVVVFGGYLAGGRPSAPTTPVADPISVSSWAVGDHHQLAPASGLAQRLATAGKGPGVVLGVGRQPQHGGETMPRTLRGCGAGGLHLGACHKAEFGND